jgi:dephospho-CoA kinase
MKAFQEFLDEGVNDPAIFKAIILAGGPGSGKSFVVGKTALQPLGFKLINSDIAFEKALAKAGLEATPDNIMSPTGQIARASAKAITGKQMYRALEGRNGIVIDGTGKDYNKIAGQVNDLRNIGYAVAMIFVNADLDTALERNKLRKRSLADKDVEKMWQGVQNNIGKFQNLFRERMVIVDNSNGSNIEGATLRAYTWMMKWSKKKPENRIAIKWIKDQSASK